MPAHNSNYQYEFYKKNVSIVNVMLAKINDGIFYCCAHIHCHSIKSIIINRNTY